MSSRKIWDRNSLLFFCTTYASKVQVQFGEYKQNMLSLKVGRYSSAWIPMQNLEGGSRDERISWYLYVLGTPLQVPAGSRIMEKATASGSSFLWEPGGCWWRRCLCSAASSSSTQWKENCPLSPMWMWPVFMKVACQIRQQEVTSQRRKLVHSGFASETRVTVGL